MQEEWVTLKDFPEYKLSSTGRIISFVRYKQGKELKPWIGKSTTRGNTYLIYSFGRKHKKYLHRLVAEYFIPNPDNKPCVNHKDGNKMNNTISNLEWVDYSYNNYHAYAMGLKKPAKRKKKESVHENI